MQKNKFNQGQTLVEGIVAIGIIMTGVFAAIALTAMTVSAGRISEFSLAASYLSREGIEVARNTRDSNWLARERGQNFPSENRRYKWDDTMYGVDNDYSAVINFNPAQNTWTFDFSPDDFNSCVQDGTCRLYRTSENIYTHTASDNVATPYYRLIFMNPICFDETIKHDGEECGSTNPMIGMEIVSETRWQENGRWEKTSLVERLYNWKIGG